MSFGADWMSIVYRIQSISVPSVNMNTKWKRHSLSKDLSVLNKESLFLSLSKLLSPNKGKRHYHTHSLNWYSARHLPKETTTVSSSLSLYRANCQTSHNTPSGVFSSCLKSYLFNPARNSEGSSKMPSPPCGFWVSVALTHYTAITYWLVKMMLT